VLHRCLDHTRFAVSPEFGDNVDVLADRVLDVLKGIRFIGALGSTAGEARDNRRR
jgi:hypothetical protein